MIGTTVSHYRILERLGGGGMGVVYEAEDLTLRRKVAIKFLPDSLAEDPRALERFRQEARTASALNHPHICTIYELGEEQGRSFIVMELMGGQILKDRLGSEPMLADRVMQLGVQVADALRAAHEAGIIHRDIKPANLFVTERGDAKVLDFGLAKVTEDRAREMTRAWDITEAETQIAPEQLTKPGTVLGTVAYMSPEQVRGEKLDERTDLFSLGVVLYEMATGRQPFAGKTAGAIFDSILNRAPTAPVRVNPALPDELERILDKALEKDRTLRYQHAADLKADLRRLLRDTTAASVPTAAEPAAMPSRRAPWLGLGVLALAAAIVGGVYYFGERTGQGPSSSQQRTSEVRRLRPLMVSAAVEENPAISADGTQLAFSREVNGYLKVFSLDLATGEERQLTEGAVDDIQPVWSPDGATLLFVRANRPSGKVQLSDPYAVHDYGDVWRLELATGKLIKIATESFRPMFSPDAERIAFYAAWAGPYRIWVSDPFGRNPEQITRDESEQVAHLSPRWSPDGTKIVFQNLTKKSDIRVVDVDTGEMWWVTDDPYIDVDPVWSPDGSSIYFSSYRSGGMNIWRVPIGETGSPTGPIEQVTTGAGADVQPVFHPDGDALAFAVLKRNADIWRLPVDPVTGTPTGEPEPLIVTTREESRGAWSPDGSSVAFNSDRGGDMNLWLLNLDDGSTRPVTRGPGGDFQAHWSPDGTSLAFFSMRAGNADVWTVDIESSQLDQLTDSPAVDINPFYSPDGRWIAFQSDRGGRREVWVMRADGSEERQLTSNTFGGVHYLQWTADSSRVLFRGAQGGAWLVPVEGGEPELLSRHGGGWHMSLSPDRSRILENDHQALFVTEARLEAPQTKVFEFDDPSISIDYSVWSPDGGWVLFDRSEAVAGDIWLLELED